MVQYTVDHKFNIPTTLIKVSLVIHTSSHASNKQPAEL